MRERVEDLGKLSILIKNILDHEIFNENNLPKRPKDTLNWFDSLTEDVKDQVLTNWSYGIKDLETKLYEILAIADGSEYLNEMRNDL